MTVIDSSETTAAPLLKRRSSPRIQTQSAQGEAVSKETTAMQKGQRLIIAGFVTAVVGIVLYCMATFSTDFGQQEPVFIKESLGIIGVGTLVWLIGAVRYLNAAIDSNSTDEDLL